LTKNQFQGYGIFAYFVLGIRDIDTSTSKQKKTKTKIVTRFIQGSVVGGYSTYFVTKDTKSLSKYKTTIFTVYKMLNFGYF
jgi:hypothetical protein